jgi:hypothetical protein
MSATSSIALRRGEYQPSLRAQFIDRSRWSNVLALLALII